MRVLLVAALSLWMQSSGISVVNNVPAKWARENGKGMRVEQRMSGLNEALAAEFPEVGRFPYWDHVGMVGMGSGIYLGNGCVITSAHVGCYPFRMHDGTSYEPDYQSWAILRNADNTQSDLAVFRVRVDSFSSLARLAPLAIGGAQELHPVLFVGTGFTQGQQPIALSSGGKFLAALGYRVQPHRGTVWGINQTSEPLDRPVATGKESLTHCFSTRFDRTDFAGQAVDGDSGGAAFSYNPELERWELVGCIIAVSQPDATVTFGCRTYIGDLDSYASQIPMAPGRSPDRAEAGFRIPKIQAAIQGRPVSAR